MWNQQNGLLQDSIRGLAQTPDGFLSVASEEGLVRFDGAEFFVPGEFQQEALQAPESDVFVRRCSR